jgi:hypothetical protein
VIKSRRIRKVGHVARTGDSRGADRVLVGDTWGEREHLKDPDVDGRIILKWIFKRWDGETWTGLVWLRAGKCDGLL